MSRNKKRETAELSSAHATISDSSSKLPDKDMGEGGIPSESISSVSAAGNATSGISRAVDRHLTSEQGVHYPPTSCYEYYDAGYNGTFPQSADQGSSTIAAGSYTGIQPDNPSLLYYHPGYGPYTTGFVGVDGNQTYTSSEYLPKPSSYGGSEAFPCYTYARNVSTGAAARSGSAMSEVGPGGFRRSNGFNIAKANTNLSSRTSALPSNSKVQQPAARFSRSTYQNQSQNPLDRLGSGFRSAGPMRGSHPTGNFSSSTHRHPRAFWQYGPVNYQSNDSIWNNNYRYKPRDNFGTSGEIKAATELTCGPRADNPSKLPSEVNCSIERDKYNLQEFPTVYDNAKFYVIKSYSEDDIHKCIKYDVWSSTPNGNKKLDAAFSEANAKTSETGIKCPVFLFFSVNGSGQFVGVVEMIGPVDFSKNMDFWQLDKWNGFFPIKWHIIKDVPNTLLRHIILESNDNRPVTYTRDTQEIGLKQGLEMLSIFKSYSEKTSVLDDFDFYEKREKLLRAKRNSSQASHTDGFKNGDYEEHLESGEGAIREQSANTNQSDTSSLISLTQNLSLNSQPRKSSI